jgi:hypothetical protein
MNCLRRCRAVRRVCRREDGQIRVLLELVERRLTIADCGKLAIRDLDLDLDLDQIQCLEEPPVAIDISIS